MAKGFKHGSTIVGGVVENPLNFAVANGFNTPPSNPAENTIWVNTGLAIENWVFSTTRPENPTQGMVWFSVGTSSPVEFNVLKDNCIQVYPISAEIYNNGEWSTKEAKSYQNGNWVEWFPEGAVYCNGAFAVPVGATDTGGSVRGSYTEYDGYFVMKMGTAGYAMQVITQSVEDVTNYSTITVDFNSLTPVNDKAEVKVFANTTRADATSLPASAKVTNKASGTVTVDVSKLTGSYYLGISIYNTAAQEVKITDWRRNK